MWESVKCIKSLDLVMSGSVQEDRSTHCKRTKISFFSSYTFLMFSSIVVYFYKIICCTKHIYHFL